GLGHGQALANALSDGDAHRHARTDAPAGIGYFSAGGGRAGLLVDPGVIRAMRPAKVSPARASAVAVMATPGCSTERYRSGRGKSRRTTLTSSRVVITAPGLIRVPGVTVVRPSTPENGARITRSPRCAWAASSPARAASRAVSAFSAVTRGATPRSASSR